MKNKFLEGERIFLAPLDKEDLLGNYVSWLNDAEVCQYSLHQRYPFTHEAAEEFLASIGQDKSRILLGIFLKDSGIHIGNISLQNINYVDRMAEIAFLMGEKKHWGKGFSTEAGSLLINHAFKNLNLLRIECGTASPNVGMLKLANKLGMVQEGTRRKAFFKNGIYMDFIEFGLLRDEFKSFTFKKA